jgi:hypothetical protein
LFQTPSEDSLITGQHEDLRPSSSNPPPAAPADRDTSPDSDIVVSSRPVFDTAEKDTTLSVFDDWREGTIEAISTAFAIGSPYESGFRASVIAETSEVAASALLSMIDSLVHVEFPQVVEWTPPLNAPYCRRPPSLVTLFHPAAFNHFSM